MRLLALALRDGGQKSGCFGDHLLDFSAEDFGGYGEVGADHFGGLNWRLGGNAATMSVLCGSREDGSLMFAVCLLGLCRHNGRGRDKLTVASLQ